VEVTRLSSKGQMVVPKSVRDALQLPVGAELSVEVGDGCFVVRPRHRIRPTTIDEVAGMFKVNRRVTLKDMERGIEAALRERWERKR
jgi:AbrB family looped-hinge helix DNA binding protein